VHIHLVSVIRYKLLSVRKSVSDGFVETCGLIIYCGYVLSMLQEVCHLKNIMFKGMNISLE
jgi:hypothetical protein